MTEKFDTKKAREICGKLREYYESGRHPECEPIIVSDAAKLLPAALDRIEVLEGNHCADCCCARAWKALEISEYTGKSISEEITALKAENAKRQDALCESEARSLLNFQRFEEAMEGELMWARTHDWDACHEEERQDRIDFARRGLKAEGKL